MHLILHWTRWLMLLASPVCLASPVQIDSLPERPLFRIFGTQHGLPSSIVYSLAIDAEGNLWLATHDGLARYDGVGFQVWRHDPDDPDSLPDNEVDQIVIDDRNQIWLAVQDGGLVRYRPQDDGFDRWSHDPGNPDGLPTNRIWSLASDHAGGVWLGGYESGLSHLAADGRLRSWRHDPADPASLCEDTILSLLQADDGTLWIGSPHLLCRYQPDAGFSMVAVPTPPTLAPPRMIYRLQAEADTLWLSSSVGLRAIPLDGDDHPSIPAALSNVAGSSMMFEPDGTLWYASRSGIRHWHPGSGEITIHRARAGRALVLQEPWFNDALRDREGSLWFTSRGGGLAQLVPRWRAVRTYLADPDNPAGLPANRVQMLNRDHDGRLWIVADSQAPVSELDPATGLVRRWFPVGSDDPLPDRSFLSVRRDRAGRIWLAGRSMLIRYDPDSEQLHRIERDDEGRTFPGTASRILVEHPGGHLISAFGGGGILIVHPDTLAARFDPLGQEKNLPCAEIYDIRFDADGGIWMACERGVLHAAGIDQPFRAPAGAPRVAVDSLDLAPDGSLWLHTLGQLRQFGIAEHRLLPLLAIGSREQWPSVRAGGIVIDDDGIVWATTSRGLYSWDPALAQIAHYDRDDGLPNAEFSSTPPVRLGPNFIAAGTLTGPVVIDTRALRAPLPETRLRWYEASVIRGDQPEVLTLANGEPLRLAHDDRNLAISVRLNSHVKPGAHRYRFFLQGYDSAWVEQVGTPERVFERLPSGHYTLRVQVAAGIGQAEGNILEQDIHVEQPPWRQPWAYAAYLLLLVLTLFAGQRAYRDRLLRRQALALAEERQRWAEQANDAKTRFLTDIGHEIRTPMAGLLGMNELLLRTGLNDRQRRYARSVRNAGDHMLTLINDLLDLSRIEAGQLELDEQPLDLVVLIDELIDDVAASAEHKGLALSIRIQPPVPLTVVADGKRLKQILLNLLNNAVKFTPQGRVRLCVGLVDGRHRFVVEDDGIGLSDTIRRKLFDRFSQDDSGRRTGGSGLGLAIARELATLMDATLDAENRAEGGSRFSLTLALATTEHPSTEAHDLPVVLVLDRDPVRADDLVTSLRALAAEASVLTDPADIDDHPDAIVLVRADDEDQALSILAGLGSIKREVIVSLPLSAAMKPGSKISHVLAWPWRLREVVRACRNQKVMTGSSPEGRQQPNLSGLTLLLVEDDPVLREVVSTRLSGMGAEVVTTDNGLSALAEIQTGRFDGVLLDLDLPQLDGREVLALARRQLGAQAPPFLIITARQQPDDEEASRRAGAIGFYRKPIDLNRLARDLLSARGDDISAKKATDTGAGGSSDPD